MYAIEKSSFIERYTYIPKEIKINQQAWLNILNERLSWLGWVLPIKKKELKIKIKQNITTADKERKCDISPIMFLPPQLIALGAYNFHHV